MSMSTSPLPNVPLSPVTALPPSFPQLTPTSQTTETSDRPSPTPSALARFDWQPMTDGVLDAIQRVYY